jgi:UDP-N-acetylglucosamine 4,6-dehydratase
MTTYSIGEMAKKIGKTVETLRRWDEKGVLKAKRTPSNHRYYTHDQYLKISGEEEYIPSSSIDGSVTLITGSGTLATCAVGMLKDRCKKIIIYSRDEHKQRKLRSKFSDADNIRYIIGDIKDKNKLMSSMKGADICLHTAALKMVETGFYSADEVVRVNTVGTMNVAEVAIERGVKKALFISSDKASSPLNGLTYGLSKALAESVWLTYNNQSTRGGTVLFATRYGNIINSNNSFYDIIEEQKKKGVIKITDSDMSRFYFTIEDAMKLNIYAIDHALGGEIFIPSLSSAKLMTFVEAFASGYPTQIIGLRGTEKLAEEMISKHEMPYTYLCHDACGTKYYKIVPPYIKQKGMGWDKDRPEEKPVVPFVYTSDSKDVKKLTPGDLRDMVKK